MLTPEQELEFCRLRREIIGLNYQTLNSEQRRAVLATEGPLLLLAGAGSGKTTVLIHRVANLIRYGRGSDSDEVPDWATEADLDFLRAYAASPDKGKRLQADRLCALDPAAPWSIIAITFTNKAAGELKARLEKMLGPSARDIWASTFHSACVRILRRDIEKLGFPSSFTIYDTDDSQRVMKDCLKELRFDDKQFPARSVLATISRAKDKLQLAADFARDAGQSGDFRLQKIAQLYTEYEKRLWEAGALDFDDIILHTVRLLQEHDDVLEYYQKKFRYVLIDEYQDTNNLQYLLSSLLAGGHENICVVGDDDQSIYRFRGATIENILSFEDQYKNCRTIRLEQNYRSTKSILAAANAVIRHNQGRKGKELWTAGREGEKVQLYTAMNENDEARYVADKLMGDFRDGVKWNTHAILYRMNAQSNQLEVAFKRSGIPYKVIGGTRFFDRAEVKDMLAYLCAIHNHADDLRLTRIINNPPRGIGNTTVEKARDIALREGLSLWEVASNASAYPELQKPAPKLAQFAALLEEKFDFIFFTGSQEVGKEVLRRAAEHLTPAVLELGGKSPCIVDETARLPLAARRIVFGKYLNCGQTCVAPDYILCHSSVKDRLGDALRREIRRQYGAEPLDNPSYGRIVNEKHFQRLLGLIDPDKVAAGGQSRPETLQIAPTILDRVAGDDPVMQEEIFGPILPVLTYDRFEDLYAALADRAKPLALYLFSQDRARVREAMSRFRFGGGCVNDVVIHLASSELGFGGVGESGMGAYHGRAGFEAFSHAKSIVDKKTWVDLPMRYQPYQEGRYGKLVRLFLR